MAVTLEELAQDVVAFRNDRDWKQFHNPKDVAISLSLEASELLELFQWRTTAESEHIGDERREDLQDEMADVFYWLLVLSHDLDVDLGAALSAKLAKNAVKYPADLSRGSRNKYTSLSNERPGL